ncbi:MAG: cysteine--tRNA ligase [Defluviitaleaceae bacterium]|nr:cysteine--tRNA ligase [Defluviitaleaceae bacterium]MCL2238784.1 cysteine--tRNA ligase [Defluviitaleaceae bacterium]
MSIYNTLTRRKEPFVPLDPGGKTVKMYTCGQTVYNDIHMGNARFYVVFDAVRRYMAYRGFDLQFMQNFTDIDDKIIARAAQEGRAVADIANTYIARTLEDLESLNVWLADKHPCATQEIPEIIAMVEKLIAKDAAYERGGTVYFDTTRAAHYGKLSRKNPDDLLAGARIEIDSDKRNPADFVLWKPAKAGEPFWESPWGRGRPGWHIECSAMAYKYLGEEIDIHGGGADLIFPHHENEIAQTEAVTGKPFSRYWMHCGILTVDHKKMSKSRGNFQTLREVAARFPYDVIRFYLLSGHYRMPMEFGDELIAAAGRGLERIRNCYGALKRAEGAPQGEGNASTAPFVEKFHASMDDDFNTADAVTAIFEWVKYVNTGLAQWESPSSALITGLLEELTHMCGLLGISLEEAHSSPGGNVPDADIEAQIAARTAAKKARDFAEADRIRDELAKQGILLEDTRAGVIWKRT